MTSKSGKKKLSTKICNWYSGFVDVRMSDPKDEDFSISIKPVPASRLKRIVDWSLKFWRRNWGVLISISIAFLGLVIAIIVNWSSLEKFFSYIKTK
jgi:hypothetical protein